MFSCGESFPLVRFAAGKITTFSVTFVDKGVVEIGNSWFFDSFSWFDCVVENVLFSAHFFISIILD